MKKWILFLLLCSSSLLLASDENEEPQGWNLWQMLDVREQVRPYLERTIGYEYTDTLLGKSPESIRLPEIPEIVTNASATLKDQSQAKDIVLKLSAQEVQKNHIDFMRELYFAVLKRRPTTGEIDKWINVLMQGGTREGIYRALVLSAEYKALEDYRNPPSKRLTIFAYQYFENYLNMTFEQQKLEDLNLFIIKRMMAEKSLELVDTFLTAHKVQELYDWYAVLSFSLARFFTEEWKGINRGKPLKSFHRKWASKVPFDYLRGELVLKLHSACNFLM